MSCVNVEWLNAISEATPYLCSTVLLHPHNLPSICSLCWEHPALLTVKKLPPPPHCTLCPRASCVQPVSGHQPSSFPFRAAQKQGMQPVETGRQVQLLGFSSCHGVSQPHQGWGLVWWETRGQPKRSLFPALALLKEVIISCTLASLLYTGHCLSFVTSAFERGREHPTCGWLQSRVQLYQSLHKPSSTGLLVFHCPQPASFHSFTLISHYSPRIASHSAQNSALERKSLCPEGEDGQTSREVEVVAHCCPPEI